VIGKRISFIGITTLIAALTVFPGTAAAQDQSGTWKLNPARSQFSPGPAPKDLVEIIEVDKNTYKGEGNGTAADGKPIHLEFNAKFDGKDYPITGIPSADMQSAKWLDAHTPQLIQKKNGKLTVTVTCKVSPDGKTRTCVIKGKDPEGRNVNDVAVFDRQ
jgi:hypothetical protein